LEEEKVNMRTYILIVIALLSACAGAVDSELDEQSAIATPPIETVAGAPLDWALIQRRTDFLACCVHSAGLTPAECIDIWDTQDTYVSSETACAWRAR
jgi:hypothetical protein